MTAHGRPLFINLNDEGWSNVVSLAPPVRIFIGTSANGEDLEAEIAYEHSLRKNCSRDIEIVWMRQTQDRSSFWFGFETSTWSTPFSGFRWAIPEYCGFHGRALYTDVDMINRRDISQLFDLDLQGRALAARRGTRFGGFEFCVTLFDCAAMQPFLAAMNIWDRTFHHNAMAFFSSHPELLLTIDPRWNCFDGEGRSVEDIWQLHFTRMSTQPWKPAWFTGTPEMHERRDLVDLWRKHRELGYAIGLNGAGENPGGPVTYDIIGR